MPADEWPVRESHVTDDDGRVTHGYDIVERPDGTDGRYDWVEFAPAVVVVATVDGDVLFVNQYRPVAGETHRELPAGTVEAHTDGECHADGTVPREGGESYESAAARELREETGYVPDETTLIQRFALETSVMRHERGIVYADGLAPGERSLDDGEFLSVERIPMDEALAVAREQPANDLTIEGLLLAKEDGLL